MLMVRDRHDPLPRKEVFLFDYLILFGYNLLLNGQIGIKDFSLSLTVSNRLNFLANLLLSCIFKLVNIVCKPQLSAAKSYLLEFLWEIRLQAKAGGVKIHADIHTK